MPKGCYKRSDSFKEKMKIIAKNRTFSNETKLKMSAATKGSNNPMFGRTHTPETREKLRQLTMKQFKTLGHPSIGRKHSPETIAKLKEAQIKHNWKGERNSNWKGGVTTEYLKARASIESRIWREAVLARDGWKCQKYGTVGGVLVAHHIKNFSHYPELRYAIDNGITLSDKAHREFHIKYGARNNTIEQIEEFLDREEK